MRNIEKMNSFNNGNRTLIESAVIPELAWALKDWKKETEQATCVLIGGQAVSHWCKPRSTMDLDFAFVSDADIPTQVEGFKRTRDHAFLHRETHVEIEVLTSSFLKISPVLIKKALATSVLSSGVQIACPEALICLKCYRWSLQDRADIESLMKYLGNNAIGDVLNWASSVRDAFSKEAMAHLNSVLLNEGH